VTGARDSIRRGVGAARAKLRRGPEADKATAYWADLPSYHASNDENPLALERSRWLAEVVVPELGAESVLELGTNSGRNLGVIREHHPDARLLGLDVNARALEHARAQHPTIDFQLQDVNRWSEGPDSWDAILTMSVLDHIPDDAMESLARNVASTARYVIAVELWDGGEGERGLYKYSRDTRALFEAHGARTLRWELSPGQYDMKKSPLYAYVGEFGRSSASGGE